MKIPQSDRKKALLVVDVQPDFLDERSRYIIGNISKLLEAMTYDLYIDAVFHTDKGSVWHKQRKYTLPKGEKTKTDDALAATLKKRGAKRITKQTKSAFHADDIELAVFLKEHGIKEVHIVGTETDECVLATAFDSFDSGFITYVIEECCESGSVEIHKSGLKILRKQNLTNNSSKEKLQFVEVEVT